MASGSGPVFAGRMQASVQIFERGGSFQDVSQEYDG